MTTTLKENYKNKKLKTLVEKAKKADYLLNENNSSYHANLILEALDKDEYEQATEVIEKLQKINDAAKEANMDLLTGAIDTVVKAINDFTGGSTLSRFKGNVASLFNKNPAKNPILAGLAMVNALEAGFKVLPTILKNNIKDIEKDKEKQGKSLKEITQDDDKLKKNIESNLIKAFVPEGTFGKVFKKIPGIETPNLVADLFFATPEQLGKIAQILKSGTTTGDVSPEIANPQKAEKGEAGTEKTDTSEPGKAPEGNAKVMLVKATQDAAKAAGVKDGKALQALMNKLGYEIGSYESTLVMPSLQNLMADKNIPDDQTDGFIRGLMSDFDKDFKKSLDEKIKKALEKLKEKQAKSGEDSKSPENMAATLAASIGQKGAGKVNAPGPKQAN